MTAVEVRVIKTKYTIYVQAVHLIMVVYCSR